MCATACHACRVVTAECITRQSVPEMGQQCQDDPLCVAIIYKPGKRHVGCVGTTCAALAWTARYSCLLQMRRRPWESAPGGACSHALLSRRPLLARCLHASAGGTVNSSKPFGMFRRAEGANQNLSVLNPMGVVYWKLGGANDGTASGGLSAGAIAGTPERQRCRAAPGGLSPCAARLFVARLTPAPCRALSLQALRWVRLLQPWQRWVLRGCCCGGATAGGAAMRPQRHQQQPLRKAAR